MHVCVLYHCSFFCSISIPLSRSCSCGRLNLYASVKCEPSHICNAVLSQFNTHTHAHMQRLIQLTCIKLRCIMRISLLLLGRWQCSCTQEFCYCGPYAERWSCVHMYSWHKTLNLAMLGGILRVYVCGLFGTEVNVLLCDMAWRIPNCVQTRIKCKYVHLPAMLIVLSCR